MKYNYKGFFLFFLIFYSCGNNEPQQQKKFNPNDYKDPLVAANKHLVKAEEKQIEDYISRYNWNMRETGTGLRYLIYKKGNGEKAEKNKIAKINFTVSLINGNVCYSSDIEGSKEFFIGRGGVETGIEEGILLLRVGDKAKFIIPSHLAFGLLGDQDKIPTRATLIYDIELLELK